MTNPNNNQIDDALWEKLYPDMSIRLLAKARYDELQNEIKQLADEKKEREEEINLLQKTRSAIVGTENRIDQKISKLQSELQTIADRGLSMKNVAAATNTRPAPPPIATKPPTAVKEEKKVEIKTAVPPATPSAAANKPPVNLTDNNLALKLEQARAREKALHESQTATVADIAAIQKEISDLEKKAESTIVPELKPVPKKPEPAPIAPQPVPQPVAEAMPITEEIIETAPAPTSSVQPAVQNSNSLSNTPPSAMENSLSPNMGNSKPNYTVENRLYRSKNDIVDALCITDKGRGLYDMARDDLSNLHIVKSQENGLWLVWGDINDQNNPNVVNFSANELAYFPGLMEAIDTILFDAVPRDFNLPV